MWPVALLCPWDKQEYWSGWSIPSPGDLPDPGIDRLSCTVGKFFTIWATGKIRVTPLLLTPLWSSCSSHSHFLAWVSIGFESSEEWPRWKSPAWEWAEHWDSLRRLAPGWWFLRVITEHSFANTHSWLPRTPQLSATGHVSRGDWRRCTQQVSHLGGLGNGPEMMTWWRLGFQKHRPGKWQCALTLQEWMRQSRWESQC